jgi:NAD(P)-dependent dehydrogenase (short-subunit alcohol dehydrogenase family)
MNKRALVTGIDTNVMARDISLSLLEQGFNIVAVMGGDPENRETELTLFKEQYPFLSGLTLEVVDYYSEASIQNLINGLSNDKFDTLIFCATTLAALPGGGLRNESVDFDYTEFNRVMQYNVSAVAAICYGLKDNIHKGGSIINISTSAAQEGAFATISYNASKAALENLTKSLASTLGIAKGIRANVIAPGWIPPSEDVAAGSVVALANALTPSLVNGKPQDVVAAVHYLINSSFHNGAVFNLDGGITSSYLPYMLESLQLQGKLPDDTMERITTLISGSKDMLLSQ